MLTRTHRIIISAGWILLCTLISFAVQGQVMEPAANWFQYLPLMAEIHDPSLYPRDDFVPILVEKTPSWFYWVLGKLLPATDPYLHLFLLNLLTRLAAGALLYWLASGLANDWRAGLIAVFLLSGQVDTVLGRGDINWPYFTHTALSVPLLLVSLGLLLRRRLEAAFAVAGLLWNIHLLNAAYYSVFLAIWLGMQLWRSRPRPGATQSRPREPSVAPGRTAGVRLGSADLPIAPTGAASSARTGDHGQDAHATSPGLRRSLRCVGLALLFALPVLPRLLSALTAGGGGDEIWMKHALAYHERLLSPFAQPLDAWVRFSGYLLLLFVMVRRRPDARLRHTGWAMLAMWGALYLLGYLFTALFPLPLFLKLQPCRCTDVFLLLFFAWFACETLEGLAHGPLCERALHWALLALLYFFNLRTLSSPLKDSLTVVWLVLVLAKTRLAFLPTSSQSLEERRLWTAAIGGSVAYVILVLAVSYRGVFTRVPGLAVLLGERHLLLTSFLFLVAVAYLAARFSFSPAARARRWASRIPLFLLLFLAVEWVSRAGVFAASRRERTGHLIFDRFHPFFYEAARWCRRHTPPHALFIVPPYRGGFRSESLRSVVVSWDEQLAFWIAPDYVREYDRRLRLLGYEPYREQDPRAAWQPTLSQILTVRDEFDADYLVLETTQSLPLPVVYRNPGYTVYLLRLSTAEPH